MKKDKLLKKLKDTIDAKDNMALRKLSGEYTMLAVSDQSEEIIKLAIISYCMHKVLSKVHFAKKTDKLIYYVREKLEKNELGGVLESIESFDRIHGLFQGNLVKKAGIKIGARLYSNGLSISQAAALVDVEVSDILRYVGGTKTETVETKSVRDRLEAVRKVLR